jgi:hypothetical protein
MSRTSSPARRNWAIGLDQPDLLVVAQRAGRQAELAHRRAERRVGTLARHEPQPPETGVFRKTGHGFCKTALNDATLVAQV